VSSPAVEVARPELNARQARTVENLLDAGTAELRSVGLDALTIRTVALRAGVSPATAYTYFDSKDHLFAEMFWRHLRSHPSPAPTRDEPTQNLAGLTQSLAGMLDDFPEMAAAATRALLGTDPTVARLRIRIGTEYLARFQAALGPAAEREVLDTLLMAFFGALLQSGMGLLEQGELADRLDRAFAVIMRGNA
jgi:AcrR family transcriptional regulator